ncbi:MAG: long-chain fatty acid transport protein [Paracoccaceae bacterium]|jgi:long-chain fatty acid transport protein
MNKFMTAGAALLATTTMVSAGGIDRSGQPITAIFEDGNYVELSFGSVSPSISGTLAGNPSGNIGVDYTQLGFAMKTDLTDAFSVALIIDQPFGANVAYPTGTGYALAGLSAEVTTTGTTVLGRYKINDRFSVHGGARMVTASGQYDAGPAGGGYNSTYSSDSATGYVIGGAYERPDIAMRIAVTYSSALDFVLDGAPGGDLTTTMPESVNLDFQTGIAADTLLFGSIRWAAWDGVVINDNSPHPAAGDLVAYTADVITYNIGVGRRFSDSFSGSIAIGHEASAGTPTGNLGPTDGYTSVQVGGAYNFGNGLEVSGGVRYIWIGDATTTIGANFSGNTATAVGLKMAYNF